MPLIVVPQSWICSQAVVITAMSLRLVLVGHFGQLNNLMLVLTFAFYIFIVVCVFFFFGLSVITEGTVYLFIYSFIYLFLGLHPCIMDGRLSCRIKYLLVCFV